MTRPKVGVELGVSEGTVKNLEADGEIEVVYIRRTRRVVGASVLAYVERQRAKAHDVRPFGNDAA